MENENSRKIKVYKKRWLILFTFCINIIGNALNYTFITSINNILTKYYRIKPEVVDWAANVFCLVFIFITFPSSLCIEYFGLRTLVIVGSSLNAIGASLHFVGVNRDGIYYVLAGQFISAFSVGTGLQIPAKLSSVWFPEHEHTKATAIAMTCNVFGLAIGFLQPSYMVPDSTNPDDVYEGLFNMYLSHLVFYGICLITAYLFFDEKPPLPPSYAAAMVSKKDENVPGFVESLKMMASNKDFMMLSQAYGLYLAGYNLFIICLNQMSSNIIEKTDIGWVGFSGNLTSILGMLLFSAIVDKYKWYKLMSMGLCFGTLATWTLFSMVLLYWKTYYWMYISFNILCLFGVPFIVIGMEYGAELTYPVGEDLSAAVSLILGNMYGFIYVIAFGYLIDEGHYTSVCYIVMSLYGLIFVLMCFVKERLKRHNVRVSIDSQPYSISPTPEA